MKFMLILFAAAFGSQVPLASLSQDSGSTGPIVNGAYTQTSSQVQVVDPVGVEALILI